MYHNNENEPYVNNEVPSTSYSTSQCSNMYNNQTNFLLEDSESSVSTSDSSTCNVCLQSTCICDTSSNGFDPSLLQLPQLALLMQQSTNATTSMITPSENNLSQVTPFVCQICGEWFVVHEKLVLHLVVNHSMVYCKFCTKLYTSQSEHPVCLAHRGTLPCEICHSHFRTNSSTTNHELSKHQTQVHDLHTCPLCGLTFHPKSSFISHLRRKHLCKNSPLIEKNEHLEGIITEINSWVFNCKLCKNEVKKSELFGHFNTYHKITLACMIELLHYGRIFISVQGYNNSGNVQQNECCTVCSKQITNEVPKIAHDVYCSGMAYCKYCILSFSSPLVRELHLVREHPTIPCTSCGETFPVESSLITHQARTHGAVECYCCDLLVPAASLENHLITKHSCNVPINMSVSILDHSTMGCNLCTSSARYTCDVSDVTGIFVHMKEDHCVGLTKALSVLSNVGNIKTESTSSLPQYAQVSSLEWTRNHHQPNLKEEEDILVPQVNLNASENESSDEQDAETSDIDDDREVGDAEIDPEDMECVSDSSEDEYVIPQNIEKLNCELCNETDFTSPRDLCAHLFSIHKLHWDRKGEDQSDAQYHCNLCPGYKAMDRTQLFKHKMDIHGEKSGGSKCRFCTTQFSQAELRNQHQLQVHLDQQKRFYRCPYCQHITSSTVVLSRHIMISHPTEPLGCGVRVKCRVCLLLYPSIASLRAHFRAVHPAAMVFRCSHCSAHLKTKKTLRHHVKVVHSEARRKDCSLCGKVLWSKRAYAIHYRMKHSKTSKVGFRCRICQHRFDSKEQRKLHYTIDHEGESPYHCVDCGKGFASKSGMYGHRQLHTGSGVSKCEYCGKEFTRKDSYNEHLLIHNGPRHKCPHCPKEFVQRSNLVRHIRIHTGEKPYQCTFCEKRFSDKGACNSHIRVHTREETCSCPYCGQTFSKKQKLKYHIRKHTGEGLIECEICNKMFTNSFALKEHRVIHNRQTQVVCPQCGKGFNSEKYLQRHVAIVHEPSNAFSCPLCPKTFSQQARLKAHVMTHSGVKHMKCLLCDKAYSVRKSLRRHLLEKHQVSPDHPQYKQSFHAMSPEEAGLAGITVGARPSSRRTSPRSNNTSEPSEPSTSGKKRRRVEQIVQSLQHSLSSQAEQPSTSSRLSPLVINLPKTATRKRAVRSKAEPKRRASTSEDDEEDDDDEGLNLSVVVKTGDSDVSSDS